MRRAYVLGALSTTLQLLISVRTDIAALSEYVDVRPAIKLAFLGAGFKLVTSTPT